VAQRRDVNPGLLLTVYIRIKVRLDLQADKSTIVAKGPFFPQVMNPRYRIRGTMCNARSNLISGKALILKRGFASNLLDHHQDSSSLPHTGGSKRKRGENQSRIGSGLFLKFQSKEECRKTNLIESMAPVLTPRMTVFLLYRTVTMGDNLTGWYYSASSRRTR
jgi:hypothetical protein